MVDIKEVAENIFVIDNLLYGIPKWGSVYLINEEKKALVDTGPATSVDAVLDGLKKVGVNVAGIDYVIATHIHLDHHNCLEVIILKGKSFLVREISDKLLATKNVKHGKLIATTTGKHLG